MSSYYALLSFNSGELSPKIDNRLDMERYRAGCRRLENMIPTKYGGAEKRPGTVFIKDLTTAPNALTSTTIRLMPFIYSSTVAYFVEIGNQYMRFYFDDAVLEDESADEVWIDTDYEEDDIFQLQSHQIGDVRWIVHPSYPQHKLKRTDPYTFELEEIEFRYGPFLTRNDLLDPVNESITTLRCTSAKTGQYGILIANASVFRPEHIGALFKLLHTRTTKVATISGQTSTGELKGTGTYDIVTRGTWTGTIVWQRKEVSGDWEELFSWKSSTDAYQNIIKSYVETDRNAMHRLYSDNASSALRAELSINEPLKTGIVKIVGVGDSYNATVEVLSDLDSTAATKRWAEGAWSNVRGYPGSVTFYEDRCIYAGAASGSAGDSTQIQDYPNLLNLTF
jgi:hypothetical protein